MNNKTHTSILLITLFVLTAVISGCTRQTTATAPNLPAADYGKDAQTLTTEPYEQIQKDASVAYAQLKKNGTAIPKLVPIKGMPHEYTRGVYSGILYEALVHRDFELIERAAGEARTSKEKLPGGVWKLQLIYAGLDQPYSPHSDSEWKQHLALLEQWTAAKPNSITAKVALASCENHFAWNARGTGYANAVSDENAELFEERLKETEKILWSVNGEKTCPVWYSVMQQVALAEGWDRESYESLFADSIALEPTFYDFYRQKLIYLLPQWHGAPGELEAYMNSFAVKQDKADSAMLHFMLNESLGSFEPTERDKPSAYYSVLKQGYLDLRKAYGVTERDQNWIFHKAMATNDRAFAEQLFPEVQDSGLPLRVDKQMFEAAVKAAENSKH
jgi:hypothetical protein